MKIYNKIALTMIAAGLLISVITWFMGAQTSLYVDAKGARIMGDDERHEITEPDVGAITSVEVDVSFSDIQIVRSDKFGLEIVHYGEAGLPQWKLNEGRLTVSDVSSVRNGFHFNMGFIGDWGSQTNYVRIYLPADASLDSIVLNTRSGDIQAVPFTAEKTAIKDSYGSVTLEGVKTLDLDVNLASGDFTGRDINSTDFKLKNSYGDAEITGVECAALNVDMSSGEFRVDDGTVGSAKIKNSYGDIELHGITCKGAEINASSGDIVVNGSLLGSSTIKNSFGQVELQLTPAQEEYSTDLKTSYGSVRVNGKKNDDNDSFKGGSGANNLNVRAQSGDIEVSFGR